MARKAHSQQTNAWAAPPAHGLPARVARRQQQEGAFRGQAIILRKHRTLPACLRGSVARLVRHRLQRRGSAGVLGVAAERGLAHRHPITLHSALGASHPSSAHPGLRPQARLAAGVQGLPGSAAVLWMPNGAGRARPAAAGANTGCSRRLRALPPSFKSVYQPDMTATLLPRLLLLVADQ